MENNSSSTGQNNSSNIDLASEFDKFQAMIGNTSQNTNNNNSIIIVTDEDENQETHEINNLLGAFDKAKKTSTISEEEALLLLDPNASQANTVNTNTSSNINNTINPINTNSNNNSQSTLNTETPQQIGTSILDNLENNNTNQTQSQNPSEIENANTTNNPNTESIRAQIADSQIANNIVAAAKPNKAWNQRFVIFGVCAAIIIGSIVFHSNSVAKPSPATVNDLAHALPSETSPRAADPGLHSYELGRPDEKLPSNKPKQQEDIPKLIIPSEVPVAPVATPTPAPSPTPVVAKDEPEEPEDFNIKFRAANRLAAQSLIPKDDTKQIKEEKSPLEGLRVPMQLVEPLRSGIPTKVSAVVIADVTDSLGNVVVPKGSRAQIPFLPFEVQGRVTNDISSNTVIVLPNNQKLTIKGTVKGTDGFAGLSGKVKKQNKGNLLARTGKVLGRIGARVVGVETGGIGGFVIEDSINQSINTSLPFIPTDRVVEVMAGTPFTFNIN